jgi:beta-galactosidase
MGCNAIRTAHNPPAPEFLDLCDRMGFLVMDEFSDTWTIAKKRDGYAKLFTDWSEADVRAMIRRDRNHPSVILWSIGNEMGELRMKDRAKGMAIARSLTDLCHAEDPTRPTSAGCNSAEAGFNGFNSTMDVFGFNYVPSKYTQFHEKNPQQPWLGSETASTISSRGEYQFPVSDRKEDGLIGFHVSSYDLSAPRWAQPAEWEFKAQDENPAICGEFVWTGFDYLGEPTPFNADMTNLLNYHTAEERAKAEAELKALGKIATPARSSYFGIVDLAGFKKDRFYLYQARWNPTLPMAHILPHWNWPERVGQVTPVHVYTSGDEAELFVNGASQGRKKKGAYEYRLRWDDVIYAPGEVSVVAYKDGKLWAKETVQTAGPATKLALSADRAAIGNNGKDLSFITVTVQDTQGRMVPRTRMPFTCRVSGAGTLVATDNGDPTDLTAFSSPTRSAFNGLGLIIVRRAPGVTGPIMVQVDAPDLQGATITIAATP